MSRAFVTASSQFLENTAAVATAVPITMVCWFRSTDTTLDQALVSISASATSNAFALIASGATSGDPIVADSIVGGVQSKATAGTFLANTWHHGAGVFTSATSRTAYLDGTAGTANTTSSTPAGTLNRTTIGRNSGNAAALPLYMSGRIAEVAIWSVALSTAEILALSKGLAPPYIQPASLLGYWPVWGLQSPEIDLKTGSHQMTVTGATAADHAPVQPFSHRRWGSIPLIQVASASTRPYPSLVVPFPPPTPAAALQ